MTSSGKIVEMQATGEESTFSRQEMLEMLELGEKGIKELIDAGRDALGVSWWYVGEEVGEHR